VKKVAEKLNISDLRTFRERLPLILETVAKHEAKKYTKDIVLSAKRGAELTRAIQG